MSNYCIDKLPKGLLVSILYNHGFRSMTEELLERDIADGAPVNPDGTMNFMHYLAWCIQEERKAMQ